MRFANQGVISFRVSVGGDTREGEDGLKDSEWKENKVFFEKNRHLSTVAYMDKAFIHRFGKSIIKTYLAQFIFYVLIFFVLGILIRNDVLVLYSDSILEYSPILLSVVVGFSFAARFTQMFFRNIDIHMMTFNICSRTFVKNSMRKRMGALLLCDIIMTVLIACCIIMFEIVSGCILGVEDNLKLILVCGIYLMIWEIYEMAVYYFIQPYSVDLTVKSPLFTALGVFDNVFTLVILFVRTNITNAVLLMLGILFVALLAYFIGFNYAYKTFKLRC